MLRIICVILLIIANIAPPSHAGKNRKRLNNSSPIHTQTELHQNNVNHQGKTADIEAAIRFQRKKSPSKNVLFQCPPQMLTFSCPRHYVVGAMALFGTAILISTYPTTKANGDDNLLPYRFQVSMATSMQDHVLDRSLPAPFTIPAATINAPDIKPDLACFAPYVEQQYPPFLSVVRPGQIDCGPHFKSIEETSQHFYEKTKKAGACKESTTEIVCERSTNDKHEPLAVLDGKIAGRFPFEKPLFGEAWRFLQQVFVAPFPTPRDGVVAFFDSENFPKYIATLNRIVLFGEREPSLFRDQTHGVDFFVTTPRYGFKNVEEWQDLIDEYDPELEPSFKEVVHVANNLEYYLSVSPKFLKEYHQIRAQEPGELSLSTRMSCAFNYFVYSAKFEANRFLNESFLYIQAYSKDDYLELLEDLRQTTLALYDQDPIRAAAYFLPRFTQIKPFSKGNGRLARLVMNLMLTSKNIQPPLFLSNNQYREMCRKSWSKNLFLPLELVLQKNAQTSALPTPFEAFLRHTLCTQALDRAYFSAVIDRFEQCEKGCQRKLDDLIQEASERDAS